MDYSNNLPSRDSNISNYPVPANKANKILIFIIVVLLLIIFGGGGFILAKYLYSPKPASDTPSQQPAVNQPAANSFSNLNTEKVSTPSATVDETANWKTYKTSKYEIKYPSDWKSNPTPLEGESLFKIIPSSNTSDNFYPGLVIEFKSIISTSLKTQEGIYSRLGLTQSETSFKGLPAVKYTGMTSTKNVGGRIIPGTIQQTFVLIQNSGYIYTFGYSYEGTAISKNQEDFFNQILSTFKFL